MIVPITGNVAYSITLDPTVWIFDDRKILLDDAFKDKKHEESTTDELEKASERFSREVYQQNIKPPVNKSISRLEGKEILTNSYVMPIQDFVDNAEINSDAKYASVVTNDGEEKLSLDQLKNCYFLFAIDGKPLKEDGPVHLYYKDGSNKDNPIKYVTKIIIN
ncbi:hypothetical protein [Virgibacillus ainsalahensis]